MLLVRRELISKWLIFFPPVWLLLSVSSDRSWGPGIEIQWWDCREKVGSGVLVLALMFSHRPDVFSVVAEVLSKVDGRFPWRASLK